MLVKQVTDGLTNYVWISMPAIPQTLINQIDEFTAPAAAIEQLASEKTIEGVGAILIELNQLADRIRVPAAGDANQITGTKNETT